MSCSRLYHVAVVLHGDNAAIIQIYFVELRRMPGCDRRRNCLFMARVSVVEMSTASAEQADLFLEGHPSSAWVVGVRFSWTMAFAPTSTNGRRWCHYRGWHLQAKKTRNEYWVMTGGEITNLMARSLVNGGRGGRHQRQSSFGCV
jgi:hypothetical protein